VKQAVKTGENRQNPETISNTAATRGAHRVHSI